jgi:lysophospholipase L1-like esterase
VRWDAGATRTTTIDGKLIPDDFSDFGTILFVGDSQGQGPDEFPHRVENVFKGATIVNACLGGYTLAQIADDIVANLQTYSPDIVVIEGGVNSIIQEVPIGEMIASIGTIISACIQYGAEPILVEVTPFAGYASFPVGGQAVLDTYNAEIATISDTYGYKLVKLYQVFGDPTAIDELNPLYQVIGAEDGLHWGYAGQRLATNEIINVLDPKYLKGLLIEQATDNLAVYSQDFEQGGTWDTDTASTVVAADSITAPDLTTTADTITAAAANGTLLQTHTAVSADFCFSIWLKRKTGTETVYITIDDGTTLTAVNVSATWRRFWITKDAADPVFGVQIVTDTDAVYAWGGQLEAGTYPTSYFPTVAAADERAADIAYFPSTGLTILEASKVVTLDPLWAVQDLINKSPIETPYVLEASNASTEYMRFDTGNKYFRVVKYTSVGGAQILNFSDPYIGRLANKDSAPFIVKLGYTTSDTGDMMYAFDDGGANSEKAITDFKSTYGDNIYIGSDRSGVRQFNGHLKNFIMYNSVLSAEQMQEVTGW